MTDKHNQIYSFEDFYELFFPNENNKLAIKNIRIVFEDGIIELKRFIGYGAYNAVFYADYYKNNLCKAVVFKLFVPQRFDKNTDFEYLLYLESENEGLVLNSIKVLPNQLKKYNEKKDEYIKTSKKIYNLLKDEKVNSYIPKSYEEAIFNLNNDTDELINNFLLFEYDTYENLDDYLKNTRSTTERLKIVKSLANIIGEFYYNPSVRILLLDIKPENFLYKTNKKVEDSLFKILDWDSIIEFNENYEIIGTPNLHFSYSPNEVLKLNYKNIDITTAIFMLSIVLYRAVFRKSIENGKVSNYPFSPASRFSKINLNEDAMKESLNELISLENKEGAADGFWLKFVEIMNKGYTNCSKNRYKKIGDMNEIDLFSSDIQKLIEIYENKGVHPEVMLNKAIKMAEKINAKDFEEELFTSIKEVDNEN